MYSAKDGKLIEVDDNTAEDRLMNISKQVDHQRGLNDFDDKLGVNLNPQDIFFLFNVIADLAEQLSDRNREEL